MSSKRRIRRKSCKGKVRHTSLEHADAHRHALSRLDGDRMSAYRCRFCGGWHVGHTPGAKR